MAKKDKKLKNKANKIPAKSKEAITVEEEKETAESVASAPEASVPSERNEVALSAVTVAGAAADVEAPDPEKERATKESVSEEKAEVKAEKPDKPVRRTMKKIKEKVGKQTKPKKEKADATAKSAKAPTETKKPAVAADDVGKAQERPAKRGRKPAEPKVYSYIQYQGWQRDISELAEKARADFKSAHKRISIESMKLYLKPEEGAAYYVVNESYTGKVRV